MKNITIHFSGKLDYEYDESGSKCFDFFIKNEKNKTKTFLPYRFYQKNYDLTSHVLLKGYDKLGEFDSKNLMIDFLIELLKKDFDISIEEIMNYDI